MASELRITGMHCGGCVTRVTKALKAIDPAVAVSLEPPRAQFSEGVEVSVDAVNAALQSIGDYRASEAA